MAKRITVGQIAQALRCHERSARGYLHEVNQSVDRYASNLAEAIDPQTVVALCRRHRDSMLSKRLVPLLVRIR